VLVALKDKVLTVGTLSNPTKIDGLLNAFGDNVFSDMSTKGASRLVDIMRQVSDSKIASVSLADKPHQLVTTDQIGGTSVVLRPHCLRITGIPYRVALCQILPLIGLYLSTYPPGKILIRSTILSITTVLRRSKHCQLV